MSEETITVSKLDAAKRQLRTAIRLWFADGDPVSIHALVCAAHEIVHTLFKRRGLSGLMFDSTVIPDEHRSEFARAMKSYATFFKHAQRDPDGEITFAPVTNEYLLLFTVHGLSRMDESSHELEGAFVAWFYLRNPHYPAAQIMATALAPETIEELRNLKKKEFLHTYALHFREHHRDGIVLNG
jgi:hypothetical protein